MRGGSPARRVLVPVLLALLLVLAVRQWFLEPLAVVSDSMEPTIASSAVVLLWKPVDRGALTNGTVIAFANPLDGRTTIKRIIAQEGQTIAIRDAELFVDDVLVDEPFVDRSRIDALYFGPVTVPAGEVFLLGDNRASSIDSRDFGAIPNTVIEGAVIVPAT